MVIGSSRRIKSKARTDDPKQQGLKQVFGSRIVDILMARTDDPKQQGLKRDSTGPLLRNNAGARTDDPKQQGLKHLPSCLESDGKTCPNR